MRFNICISGDFRWKEISIAIKTSLEETGHKVDDVLIGKNPSPYQPNEVSIIVMGKPVHHRLSKESINILLFTEQWIDVEKKRKYRSGYNYIFDTFKIIQEKEGTIFCPLTWSKVYETDIKAAGKYNYFLFGSGNPPNRKTWINKHRNQIVYFYHGCFGRKRDRYIMESKINLMIAGRHDYIFPSLHATLVTSKAKFLACNPHISYEPYIPGKHFFEFKNLNDCKKWLKDDKRRHEFEVKAYEDLKTNHSFTYYLGRALEEAGIKP